MGTKFEMKRDGGVDREMHPDDDDSWLEAGRTVVVQSVDPQPENPLMLHVVVRSTDVAFAGKTHTLSYINGDHEEVPAGTEGVFKHKVGDTITL